MNLSIDFNTLTMDEAGHLEELAGMSLDALGKAFEDPAAPKMKVLKALATIAYLRDNGGTLKAAAKAVGEMPLTTLTESVEVTADDNPPLAGAQ